MDLVIDTSALLAVLLGEPERDRVVELTSGQTLIGPGSILWEVGNAFSAMLKRHRLTLEESMRGLGIFRSVPVRYVEIDLSNALSIAQQTNLYAYDAYFLDCAARYEAPLLTLDGALRRAGKQIGLTVVEV